MLKKIGRVRLLYIVLGVLLLVGLLPLAFAGTLLSGRTAEELRSVEGRYQAQLVQDKARQIELYGQRYRDVVTGLARAFEITGGIRSPNDAGYDARLQKTLEEDSNLIALAIWPVSGELHRAFQLDVIQREEVDQRVSEVLAKMNGRGIIVSRPQIIRSGQEMALTVAAPVMGGEGGRDVVAAVIAIVSFQEVFKAVHQATSKSERELLDAGLPVVFVVDQNGRAVAHPEASVAFSEKPMTDLKVVQDWQESGDKVQSALERAFENLEFCSLGGHWELVIGHCQSRQALARTLDREAPFLQELAHVPRVISHLVFLLDHPRDHRRSPHAGNKPVGHRAALQDRAQILALRRIQLLRASGPMTFEQRFTAMLLILPQPQRDFGAGCFQNGGDRAAAVPLVIEQNRVNPLANARSSIPLGLLFEGRKQLNPPWA